MANSRVISTRMAITGESEYKSALKNINAELRSMQSSLRLVESAYAGNANSLAALTDKGRALDDVLRVQTNALQTSNTGLDAAKAAAEGYRTAIEQTKAAIEQNNIALAEARTKYGDGSKQVKDLEERDKELNTQLQTQKDYLAAAERGVSDWQTKVNNAQVAVNGTSEAIKKNNQYLDEARESADGCATSIDENGKAVSANGDKLELLGKKISLVSLAWKAATALFKFAVNTVKEGVDAFSDYEYELDQVRRTTGMTEEEVSVLGDALQRMSLFLPVAATELAKIATTAGQLGVANDSILEFTETVAKMSVVTGQDADTVATNLARISNLAGLSSDEYENLASAIVWAGDQTATTADRVEETLERISAVSSVAGFAMSDIVAIATTTSSAGVEAARAGTAIVNLFSDISTAVSEGSDELFNYAMVAGMTASEFAAAWSDDPMTALVSLLDGIKNASDKYEAVNRLGITDARQMQSIISWANSADLKGLSEELKGYYDDATALDEKVETSTENLQMMRQEVENLTTANKELRGEMNAGLAYAWENLIYKIKDANYAMLQWNSQYMELGQPSNYVYTTDVTEMRAAFDAGLPVATEMQDKTFWDTLLGNGRVWVTEDMLEYYELTGELITDESLLAEKMEELAEAAEKEADAIEQAKGNTEEYTDAQWDALDSLIALADQFKQTYDATLESFQTSPFETWRMDLESLTEEEIEALGSISDVMDNWMDDAEAKAEYASNVAYLYAQGLSSDLIAWFDEADQSTAAYYVAELAQAVKDAAAGEGDAAAVIADANAKYTASADAAKQAALDVAVAKMDLAEQVAEIEQLFVDAGGTKEQFNAWFYSTFSSEDLDVDSIVASLQDTINGGLDSVSVDAEAVTADVSALVDSLGTKGTEASDAYSESIAPVKEAAADSVDVAEDTGKKVLATTNKWLNAVNSAVSSKMQKLSATVKSSASGLPDAMYGIGQSAVSSLINGLNSRSNDLALAVAAIRAAADGTTDEDEEGTQATRHKSGLYRVPYDDYPALLHEGESVLTKREADVWRSLHGLDGLLELASASPVYGAYGGDASGGGSARTVNLTVNTKQLTQSDVDYLVNTVNRRLAQ